MLCEALHTTVSMLKFSKKNSIFLIEFGEKLYLEGRGACQCQSGKFICDTSLEFSTNLEPGNFLELMLTLIA